MTILMQMWLYCSKFDFTATNLTLLQQIWLYCKTFYFTFMKYDFTFMKYDFTSENMTILMQMGRYYVIVHCTANMTLLHRYDFTNAKWLTTLIMTLLYKED